MIIAFIDLLIILVYLGVMLVIATIVGRKESLEDFLVNRRNTKAAFLVFTVISTNVGAGTILAISSAGYETGLSYGLTAAMGTFVGFLIVAFFAARIKAFGDSSKAHTLGDFIGAKFGRQSRFLAAAILLISYFLWTALQFVGISALLNVITGWQFQTCLVLSALVVVLYTTIAGIKSDFYTDAVQFWIIVVVMFTILLPLGIKEIGGFSVLATLPANFFSPFTFAGPVFFIFGAFFGAFLYVVSMEIWQRIYAATSSKTAKTTFVVSAFLNIPLLVLPAILGMIAFLVFNGQSVDPNTAVLQLMTSILPAGILGIGLAGIMAALMSTADSMIMVGSATMLKDFFAVFKPNLSENKMLKYGRLFTFLFGMTALGVAYLLPNLIRLHLLGFFTLLIFVPAVIGGFVWRKATGKAAFLSMLVGFLAILVFVPFYPQLAFVPGFILALIVFVVTSLVSPRQGREVETS